MPEEIGVGILSYGWMGRAHSDAYAGMPKFFPVPAPPKLVAIYGRRRQRAAEFAERFGYEKFYTDWRDVVVDKDIELVDNCLPNFLHRDPCIAAAESGKHVLCEKPLARTYEEAKEMYEAARKAGVKHMTGFNYRFVPAIRLAKRLLDEGYLGKTLQFRAVYLQEWLLDPDFQLAWRLRKDMAGSGALGDLGAHIIDLARFLVGEMKAVSGLMTTFIDERPLPDDPSKKGKVDVDDAFISLVEFENGAVGSLEATRFGTGCKNLQRIEIHGTEGAIRFNLMRLNELEVYSRRDPEDRMGFRTISVTESVHPFMRHWWWPGHIVGWAHTFFHEIYHLIDCIANDKDVAPYGATFHDGAICNKIMDAIVSSSQERRWISVR